MSTSAEADGPTNLDKVLNLVTSYLFGWALGMFFTDEQEIKKTRADARENQKRGVQKEYLDMDMKDHYSPN